MDNIVQKKSPKEPWRIGQVKFFDNEKGFGFITNWNDGQDYFIHITKVLSEQKLNDSDYVIFKLGPSRKKPGTLEAFDLTLVSLFDKDHSFLISQFSQYRTENLRKAIFKALPNETVLELFKREITNFSNLSNDQEFNDLKKTIDEFTYSSDDKEFKEELAQIMSTWANQLNNPFFRIRLWLDEIIEELPEEAHIEKHFLESENKDRLLILKRTNSPFREKLIQTLTNKEEPEEILKLVIIHLRHVNDLGNYEDIKSNLYNREYWDGKKDYDLFTYTINYLVESLNENQILSLFFNGYFDSLPSKNEELIIKYFIESEEKERFKILKMVDDAHIKEKLVQELISLEDPENIFAFIINHLRQVNFLSHYENIKSELFNKDYWEDKKDYNLFKCIVGSLQETLNEEQKLSLFFKGYFNSISSEFVLSYSSELTEKEIEKLLISSLLSKNESFKLIHNCFKKELKRLRESKSLPNQEFVQSATETDWENYDKNQVWRFHWILKMAKDHLSASDFSKIEKSVLNEIPIWLHYLLWEKRYTEIIPEEFISNILLKSKRLEQVIKIWLEKNLLSKEKIGNILHSHLSKLEKIESKSSFYFLYNHLKALTELGVDVTSTENIVVESNLWFVKLANWLEGKSTEFSFNEYKPKFVFLSPNQQVRFLKKLFWLAHTSNFDLTVEKLDQLTKIDFDLYRLNKQLNPGTPLDISVDVVIAVIKYFAEKEKFPVETELLKVALENLSQEKKLRLQIQDFFENCSGRFEAEYNWQRNGVIKKIFYGVDRFYFAIEFSPGEHVYVHNKWGGYEKFVPNEKFEELKERVKQLPGRKWNQEQKHWGVPSKFEFDVKQFASENRFFLDFEGNNYKNNTHLAEFKRKEIPNGIKFCEGRLANKKHDLFNRDFWWCCNQPCFSVCETIHNSEDWENYTLLDFLTILGFNLSDVNRVGDFIEKGKYYQFISTINRFNRLLEKMYCKKCNDILFPIEDSHFSHYRVVRFHCENDECSEHHKEVYLHHCLNGKCNGIIDSRVSQKCSNGLFICSNLECGCCCSHTMMERRLQSLETTGGYIHENLRYAVSNKLGHLERAEHFCFSCGKLMHEAPEDIFTCKDCNIQYDVTKNNFKRPHRGYARHQQHHP